jgi:RNA-directed DNA polymerase
VVDVDLAKFFDRVNHDILIDRLKRRIDDAGVIRLIRAYLNAGTVGGGVVLDRQMGTPQGGPLSPLLANVLLDEVDKALEARGYSFARYADDCNVYVGSKKAGERVMALLRKLYASLKLQINEAKSAVVSAFGRKFLGYALWVARGREVKFTVAKKPLSNFKARVRQLTRRSAGGTEALMTSNSRTARCGPACRVVWQGRLRLGPPMPIGCASTKIVHVSLTAVMEPAMFGVMEPQTGS